MSHTFEAVEASCLPCHSDADGLDIGGLQTQVAALIAELQELLVNKGLLAEEKEWEINEDGVNEQVVVGYHPVVGTYPAAESSALWNYIMLDIEDGSLGVHNPDYTIDLLDASIAALK
jgi:hypothetical protein